MRRKGRQQVIYTYKKRRYKKRHVNKNHINIPIIFLLFFFLGLIILLQSSYSSIISNKAPVVGGATSDKRLQSLKGDVSKISPFPTKYEPFMNLLSKLNAVQKVRVQEKKESLLPVARAQTNENNDFCLTVPVMLYHHVEPIDIASKEGHAQLTVDSNYFDMQMEYLSANKFHSLSAEELADALINRHSLPEKSILITLDDGYEDNYAYAYQILKKYNLQGNFMIPTGLLENNGYMTWAQLKEISDNPSMHIYNHTLTHAYLSGISKEKVQNEILTAQNQLETKLGKAVKIFTYPYGAIDQQAITILKENGFYAAFSTIGDNTQCNSTLLSLHRIHIGNAPLSSYGL